MSSEFLVNKKKNCKNKAPMQLIKPSRRMSRETAFEASKNGKYFGGLTDATSYSHLPHVAAGGRATLDNAALQTILWFLASSSEASVRQVPKQRCAYRLDVYLDRVSTLCTHSHHS